MAKFTGRQQDVGIAREATRGTIVTPAYWVPKMNYTVEDKVEKAMFEGNYGVLAGGDAALVVQKYAEGEMELELTDKIAGLLLYGLFGTLSSGAFSSVFKHTLTPQNSVQPTTLTLMMNDPIGSASAPTKSLAFAKAMINSFELSVEQGQLAKAVFSFISLAHKDYTRQSASYDADNKFSHKDLVFKIAANTASLDAASKINVQSLTLRVSKDVVREGALGTVQPVDILARRFKIDGTVRLTYEDRTYRDYMLDGTTKALRVALVKKDTTIGSTNPQIQFDLPIVHFHSWDAEEPLDEIASQEITFEALYDVTNSELVDVSQTFVVNEETSY